MDIGRSRAGNVREWLHVETVASLRLCVRSMIWHAEAQSRRGDRKVRARPDFAAGCIWNFAPGTTQRDRLPLSLIHNGAVLILPLCEYANTYGIARRDKLNHETGFQPSGHWICPYHGPLAHAGMIPGLWPSGRRRHPGWRKLSANGAASYQPRPKAWETRCDFLQRAESPYHPSARFLSITANLAHPGEWPSVIREQHPYMMADRSIRPKKTC